MINPLRKAAEMINAILPWPAKHERGEAILVARRHKERARKEARNAREIEEQIQRIIEENHFAESIMTQLGRRARDE